MNFIPRSEVVDVFENNGGTWMGITFVTQDNRERTINGRPVKPEPNANGYVRFATSDGSYRNINTQRVLNMTSRGYCYDMA